MNPCDLTATEASALLQRGELSPVVLTESLLERSRRLDGSLKVWVTLNEETALAEARAAERDIKRNGPRTPLHGIPIGLKDIFYTKGVLTTACAPQFAKFVPTFDATCVARLKDAGAIILGKTVTTQFAADDPSPTVNPWNAAHTPAGSSSGSAVGVATRMCPAALGSQTGGSTLRPAAYNGIVGFKPSYGRISKYGVFPLAHSLDTVGILCRSVEDAALLLQVMAGHDPNDPTTPTAPVGDYLKALGNARPPRIGLVRDFFYDHATEDVRRHTDAVADGLRRAGAAVEEFRLPASFNDHVAATAAVHDTEAAAYHHDMYMRNPRDYGPLLSRKIARGLTVPGYKYLLAQQSRRQFQADMAERLKSVDVLLTPATPSPAPRDLSTTGDPVFQASWTSCGLPCIAIPTGTDPAGLPLGIQLVGALFAEEQLLASALWCQRAVGKQLVPPGLD